MKSFVNEIFLHPYDKDFKTHMINELGFSDDHKKIIESLTTHYGNSCFHYENTKIPCKRFEYLLKCIITRQLDEIIRLAEVGYKHEKESKGQDLN